MAISLRTLLVETGCVRYRQDSHDQAASFHEPLVWRRSRPPNRTWSPSRDPLLGRTRIPARADAKAAACLCHVGMKRGSQGKTPWLPHLYGASGTAGRGGWGRPEVRVQPWPQPSRREGSVGRQRHQPALPPAGGPGLQNRADFRQDKGRGHDPRLHPLTAERDSTPCLHKRERHNALESKNPGLFFGDVTLRRCNAMHRTGYSYGRRQPPPLHPNPSTPIPHPPTGL